MKAMRRALGVELRRSVLSLTFLVGAGVMLLWMYLNCAEKLNDSVMRSFYTVADQLFFATASQGNLSPLILAIAAIPYAWSYCQDRGSGFLDQAAERVGYPMYGSAKALAVGVSAFLAFQAALALFTVYLFCLGIPASSYTSAYTGPYTIIAAEGHFLGYYLCRAMLSGLTCVLAAEFGLMLTAYIPNPYMAFILPLLVHYMLEMLLESLSGFFQLNLVTILPDVILFGQPYVSEVLSFVWSAGMMLLLSILCGRCFCGRIERGHGK